MMTLLPLLLFPMFADSERVHHDRPLADGVELSVSTDRKTYFVKEPVGLTMTLRNTGGIPLRGHFYLEPSEGFAEVYYRKTGSPFERFVYPPSPDTVLKGGIHMRDTRCVVVGPRILQPNEVSSYVAVLAFDDAKHGFVLQEPGEYEFKIVYRDVPNDPKGALESEVVHVDVVTPSGREGEAAAAYSEEMALLAQSDLSRHNGVERETIRRGARFLDQYPSSPFSERLKEGLRVVLRDRMTRNIVTGDEQELYEKLQAEWDSRHELSRR